MRCLLIALSAAAFALPALANPDGAPWGSADPDAPQNCASCHFDSDAIRDSEAVGLAGLQQHLSPGQIYELALKLSDGYAVTAGFMIAATRGEFLPTANGLMDATVGQARSLEAQDADGRVSWRIMWRAPESIEAGDVVLFNIAINASNDDRSPLGDQIHFKTIAMKAGK